MTNAASSPSPTMMTISLLGDHLTLAICNCSSNDFASSLLQHLLDFMPSVNTERKLNVLTTICRCSACLGVLMSAPEEESPTGDARPSSPKRGQTQKPASPSATSCVPNSMKPLHATLVATLSRNSQSQTTQDYSDAIRNLLECPTDPVLVRLQSHLSDRLSQLSRNWAMEQLSGSTAKRNT